MALRDAEINEVGRVLDEHDVPRIAQRLGEQIKQLLRAVGDQELVGGNAGGGRLIEFGQPPGRQFAEERVAGRGAVLQCRLAGARSGEDFIQQRAGFGRRQGDVVSEAGGERNELRVRQRQAHQP